MVKYIEWFFSFILEWLQLRERIFICLAAYARISYSVIGNDHCYLWFQLNWIFFSWIWHFYDNLFVCLKETSNEFQLNQICLTLTYRNLLSFENSIYTFSVETTHIRTHLHCSVSYLPYSYCEKSKSSPLMADETYQRNQMLNMVPWQQLVMCKLIIALKSLWECVCVCVCAYKLWHICKMWTYMMGMKVIW